MVCGTKLLIDMHFFLFFFGRELQWYVEGFAAIYGSQFVDMHVFIFLFFFRVSCSGMWSGVDYCAEEWSDLHRYLCLDELLSRSGG